MVKKNVGAFSIYRHINKRQRERHHTFTTHNSPSPSPEMKQDPDEIFAAPKPPRQQPMVVGPVNSHSPSTDAPLFVPADELVTAPPARNKLIPNKALREAMQKRHGQKAKARRHSPFSRSSSSEAEEAAPAEEINRVSGFPSFTRTALHRKQEPKQAAQQGASEEPQEPENIVEPTVEHSEEAQPESEAPEVIAETHRKFYTQIRRSLRGRKNAEVEHTGAQMHITPPKEYFDVCDEDDLFNSDDDAASILVVGSLRKRLKLSRIDTPHVDLADDVPMFDADDDEPATPRVRTRSMAPTSSSKKKSRPMDTLPESDTEAQKIFFAWTSQLVKKNEDLTEQLDISERRVDDLRGVISIRDEDIEKLEGKVSTLKRKMQATTNSETQLVSLEAKVAALSAQVVAANASADEHKKRYLQQNAQLVAMSNAQSTEKAKSDKQIQDLQHQINALKAQAKALPTPSPVYTPRLYNSPLSRAIGRDTEPIGSMNGHITPPKTTTPPAVAVDENKYKALHGSAKKVVQNAGSMIGENFGPFGLALKNLKDEVEK